MTDMKRPLEDMAAEAYLRASRWAGYAVPVELEDGTRVKVTLEGLDGITLEHTETGVSVDFRLQVRAVQLPAPGPEDDGATRAELADAHRHAMEPRPALGGRSPADLILLVLAKARKSHGPGCAPETCGGSRLDPCALESALNGLDCALQDEADEAGQVNAGHWHPATWAEVKDRDRIRVGGQHEATVELALPVVFVGSGAGTVRVKLEGRDSPYAMPPSGPVEVWTPSLPEWAAQAYLALAEGGLSRG